MDVTKPYKFTGFGAMDVTKPYEFIGFGAKDVTKPYKCIGQGLGKDSLRTSGRSTVRLLGTLVGARCAWEQPEAVRTTLVRHRVSF